ncbi:PAS domain-containing protein [Xanthomonas theicola]|uniref:PAS domain-containing protein n=1 Tax=Xanthomonas theicola TaxID=56464 RepID=UPI00360A4ECA
MQDAPHVRFYAGVPLRGREGWVAGTLCALDTRPRQLDPRQAQLLQDLAARVERYLFGQRQGTVAQSRGDAMRSAFQAAPFGLAAMDPEGRLAAANRALCALLGQEEAVLLGSHAQALWRGDHGTPLDLAACARDGGFRSALLQRRDGGDRQVWLNAVVSDATDAPGSIVVTLVARDEGASPWPMQEA